MTISVNLRHLEAHNVRLQGQLPAADLDIDTLDKVIQLGDPLDYDLEVQKIEDGLLIQGQLRLPLTCQCVRCLKSFRHPVELLEWTCHLVLQGEDAVPVTNDCVDLTPYVREDILLEFPQHPLCDPGCAGLPYEQEGKPVKISSVHKNEPGSSAWAELNKLKL